MLRKHGLCPPGKPDVANLPAGGVILSQMVLQVLPFRFSDGTLAEMIVNDGAIKSVKLIQGDSSVVDARNEQLTGDRQQEYLVSLALALNCCLFRKRYSR